MSEELKQAETIEEQPEVTSAENAQATAEEPAQKPESEKTFTQADIDDLIAKRLERERKKYADYDDIKTKAADYEKKLEEQRLAELSEKERAEEIAKKAEEEKSELAKQLDELRATIQSEKVNSEFIKVANANGIQYVDDARQLADLSAVKIGEDGAVQGVEEIVKALVENKPYLVAQKKAKSIGEGSNQNTDKADKTADQLLAEAAEKARRTNKPEDKIAFAKLKRELGR